MHISVEKNKFRMVLLSVVCRLMLICDWMLLVCGEINTELESFQFDMATTSVISGS